MWSTIGLSRLFIAHAHGTSLRAGDALGAAIGRVPRMVLFTLALAGIAVVAGAILLMIGLIAPVLLLLALPAMAAVVIWSVPYLTVAGLAIAVAPPTAGIIEITISVVRGRWGFVAGRLVLLILLGFLLGIPIGTIGSGILAVSLVGYLLFTAMVQAFQMVVSEAGYAVIYSNLDAPVDDELRGT